VPDLDRAHFYRDMFAMRATGALTDKEIVERLNAQGFKTRVHNRWDRAHEKIIGRTGGTPLTVKRLQETICRPIYCGVICEKWTHGKPIKAQYEGLVSIDTFNQANRGKAFIKQNDSGLEILYDYHPEKMTARRTRDNPLFPYKNLVLCPQCRKPFTGSCPRSRNGKPHPTYHCSRKHPYFGVPKEKFETTFEGFVQNLYFSPRSFDSMGTVLLDEFGRRKDEVRQAVAETERTVEELRAEQRMKSDAFVAATSPVLRTSLEKQVVELEERIKAAGSEDGKMGISEKDIEDFRAFGKETLEHLPELLLKPENTRQQTTLFSLVFDTFPTYEEMALGTPKLSWVFELSSDSANAESMLVRLHDMDWNTVEDTIKRWKAIFPFILPPN
jgi:hypothetical protein